jgi:transposase
VKPKIVAPDGRFDHARIANAYNEAMLTTTAPAKVLAEQFGVTIPTVHSWIYRARRAGALPPGRQGTARAMTSWELVADDLGVSVERLRASLGRHAPGGLRP